MRRWFTVLAVIALLAAGLGAQQATPPASLPPPGTAPTAEFLRAVDEVMAEMSQLLALPVKLPLKKSVRSREEIRAYVVAA